MPTYRVFYEWEDSSDPKDDLPKLAASGKGKKHVVADKGPGHPALSKKGKSSLLKPVSTPKVVMKPSKKHKVTVKDTNNNDDNGDNDDDKENKATDPSHTRCDKGMKNYTTQEL